MLWKLKDEAKFDQTYLDDTQALQNHFLFNSFQYRYFVQCSRAIPPDIASRFGSLIAQRQHCRHAAIAPTQNKGFEVSRKTEQSIQSLEIKSRDEKLRWNEVCRKKAIG